MAISYANVQVTKVLTLRGNTIQNNRYTGLPGELTVDTEAKTIRIHDGVTPGGNVVQGGGSLGSYGNANVKVYLTAFDGNIVPSANVTYSLGSPTRQWKDLFVSNNTIYVGGVPLSIDATGNLTVNGNVIPTIDYINAEVANVTVDLSSYALNANVTAANVGLKGYVDQANTIQSSQLTSANLGIIGYVDQANTIQSAQISAANIGIIGYIDQANTIQSAQVGAANLAITAANVGLKGYVDLANTIQSAQLTAANTAWAANASAQQTLISNLQASAYSNSNVTAFLVSHTDQTIGGNLTIQGNLTVNGNVTYISVNNLVIGDNIINLADLNPADSLDLGFAAHRTPSGQPMQHTGLVRDASANQWRLFSNVVPAPGTTVDFTNAIYDDLQLGNITSPTIDSLTLANTIQTQQIASANVGIIGYIDLANTIQSAQVGAANLAITAANVGLKGYIDQANSIQSAQITAANVGIIGYIDQGNSIQATAITTANIGMKGYVDSLTYSNVQTAAYLTTNNYLTSATANLSLYAWNGNASGGGTSYSNVNVAAYLATATINTTGNITAAYLSGNISVTGNVTGTSANVTLQAGAYTSVFDNQGNVRLPTAYVTGNVSANYFIGNGALLTGIAASSNYSNVDVANYLPTYVGTVSASLVNSSGNILSSGLSVFGNTRIGLAGAVSGQFHSVVGNITQTSSGGAVYINTTGNLLAAAVVAGAVTSTGTVAVNAATGITTNQGTFLLANTNATTINMGGAATTINLGITTSATGNVFVGGQIGSNAYNLTLRANGRYNVATSINSNGGFNSPPYANQAVIGGSGTGMTANYSSTGGYIDSLTIYNSGTGYRNGDVISVPGGIAGNSFVLQNYSPNRVGAFTATALYTFGIDGNLTLPGNVITSSSGYFMGNAGGTTASYTGNVSAANFIGSGVLLTALPGYAYSNVNVAAYLNTQGYNLYSNVNVAAYLAGNVTVGNITTAGNVSALNFVGAIQAQVGSSFAYATNAFGASQDGGGVFLPADNNSNAVVAGYTIVGNSGAVTLTVTSATVIEGSPNFVNITTTPTAVSFTYPVTVYSANYSPAKSSTITVGNATVSGNVSATYFLGNGALLTGIVASGSSYSNVQVATYLPTYSGNVANVRLGPSGVLTFADGTTQITAGGGSYSNVQVATYLPTYSGNVANIRLGVAGVLTFADGTTMTSAAAGTYSNVQVATYLPAYGGTIQSSNVQTTTANIQATTAATNPATGALRVMGGVGVAGAVFAGQLNSTGNVLANAISAYSLNTVANVVASVVNAGTINSAGNVLAQNLIGTIATASQTNITAVGTLATLNVTGNATVGNLIGTEANTRIIANVYTTTFDIYGNVTFPGNVIAPYFVGDGSRLTGIVSGGGSSYGNSNVAQYLPTYSGNVANLTVTNTLTLTATKIALGYLSGLAGSGQGADAVAVGQYSGYNTQGDNAVAIGAYAGMTQGADAIAIGKNSGTSQTTQAVAVGFSAGGTNQSLGAVALGYSAGQTAQGVRAVAIGSVAGNDNQGAQSIAIGHQAGYSYQPANSIELNATGSPLNYANLTAGLYITSVKNDTANVTNVMYYNTITKEVTYGPASGGSYSNVQVATYLPTYTGNISASFANIYSTGAGVGTVRLAGLPADQRWQLVAVNGLGTSSEGTMYARIGGGYNPVSGGAIESHIDFRMGASLGSGYMVFNTGSTPLFYANSNQVNIIATTVSNSSTSGALVVAGGVGIVGNLYAGGNAIIGVPGYTALPTTLAQFTGNANTYTQLNIQNISTGSDATSEYVATANNGTDTTFFVDMGIANSNYDVNSPNNSLGTTIFPNDSYLYAQGNLATTTGGNLAIGTSTAGKTVKIFAGGINSANIVATVSNTGLAVTGNVSATGNVNVTGYLVTAGGYGNISQVDYITANNVVATANVTVQGMGVTMPNRPAFRLNGTGLTAQTTSNVNLKGAAISTIYNQGSYFDATTGKFTVPVAGIYEVLLNARVNSSFNGLAQLVVLKNGLNTAGNIVAFWETTSNIGGATHFGVSGTVVLASGDYLSANILAGSVTFDQNDNWSVTYLG